MVHLAELPLADLDRAAIAAAVTAIRAEWPVERVILFGSKARGDDEPDSDIDLVVITATELDRPAEDTMMEAAWQAGDLHGRWIQLVVWSHERWYHGIDQATPLRLQVNQDGIEVFPDDRGRGAASHGGCRGGALQRVPG
jgi:uncharacterized protein